MTKMTNAGKRISDCQFTIGKNRPINPAQKALAKKALQSEREALKKSSL